MNILCGIGDGGNHAIEKLLATIIPEVKKLQ